MNRIGFILLLLAFVSWGLAGMITSDWQLAEHTLIGVLVFGYLLLLYTFGRQAKPKPQNDTRELSIALQLARKGTQELQELKNDFVSGVAKDVAASLLELEKSAALLLGGTYGKLPPAAEEAARQIRQAASDAARSAERYAEEPEPASSNESARSISSIKKLKVG